MSRQANLPSREEVHALPKVSLHDHLDGGIRPGTILDLAIDQGIALPVADEGALRAWVAERADSGSLVGYLEVDELTVPIRQDYDALFRIAAERVIDLADENVVYAELRWAPEECTAGGLSMQRAVDAVREGIVHGTADAASRGRIIRVGQLLCGLRHTGGALDVARIALDNRDEGGVVGFDIAGPESGYPLSPHAAAFALARENFLPITIHAGEADGLASIGEAVLLGGAIRIGHGVRIMDDIELEIRGQEVISARLGPLAAWVRDRGIHLEICPTSNVQTAAFDSPGAGLRGHPLRILHDLGFSLSISPDNSLNSATSLTEENYRVSQAFCYSLADLSRFQLDAALAAFIDLDDRKDLVETIKEEWAYA